MIIQLTYNKKINDIFRKLGVQKGQEIHIHAECQEIAAKIQEALQETVLIDITVHEAQEIYNGGLTFCGVVLAKANSRDSGVFVPPSVSMIRGSAESGGSWKHWKTIVTAGTIFRTRVPKILLEKYGTENPALSFSTAVEETTQEKNINDFI